MSTHPFDLQARAAIASQGLVGLLDPRQEGLMYFIANWQADPPRADHSLWDYGDGSGRQLDALTLTRTMARADSPAAQSDPRDGQIERWVLRQLREDGLTWLPPGAGPWSPESLMVDWKETDELCEVSWSQRGTLLGLLTRFLRTSDERYLLPAQRLVDGLLAIAVRHQHGLYFPEGYYRRGGFRFDGADLHPCLSEYNAAVVVPAARLYQVTGYAPALELAAGLTRFALWQGDGYASDGRLLPLTGQLASHFHTRSNFALSVLTVGLIGADSTDVAWARAAYEQLRDYGTEFGWFPEGLGARHGEVCCTTDMIEIALLLGRNVDRRYFADAERFGRNHLLESQWSSLDRLVSGLRSLPKRVLPELDGEACTDDSVAERQVGAFASRPTLNDAFHLDATQMMQCCNAAGARGLYDLWRYSVSERLRPDCLPERAIDLRFSVDSPALRVVSHEPASGRLDVTVRQGCALRVRLPEGCVKAEVSVDSHDQALEVEADGYVAVELPSPAEVVVRYSLPERTVEYEVGSADKLERVRGHWRGETLMSVDPPGGFHPLYGRPVDLEPVIPDRPAQPAIDTV